ncbi:hypothetical protein, partial [Sulfurimonas sp.]|uniref:hypothetical protein n=1 Tax=Sulfurimonas sp. TaxID=2022749 RepID=UPI0025D43FF1
MEFPLLPKELINLEVSVWDWWGVNEQNRKIREGGNDDKSIPLPIWKQIIQNAWDEPDVVQYIKG